MIRAAVFCLCLASVLALGIEPRVEKESRIVGGVNALPGEYPYIVSLQRFILFRPSHVCGGSILNNFHVLTAAQCFFSNPTSRYRVQAGKLLLNDFEFTEQTINVLRFVMHPLFGGGASPFDIAVVRLQSPFGFTALIQPIALPVMNSIPSGIVRVAGWGSTSTGLLPNTPNHLQQSRVAVFPNLECQFLLGGPGVAPITENNVCMGPVTGGIATCNGDSGNPVVQVTAGQNVLVGVVSWIVFPCGQPGIPSVSTRVSAFVEWINQNSVV